MINFSLDTEICRSLKQVFSFVTTPENDFHWQYGTLVSARLPQGIHDTRIFFEALVI